jgi:hypothetical protein
LKQNWALEKGGGVEGGIESKRGKNFWAYLGLKELKCRGKYTKYFGDGEEEKKRRFYGGGVRGREKSGVFQWGQISFWGLVAVDTRRHFPQ